MTERKIAPVVKIYKLGEQPSDVEYWRAQTPQARIDILEEIRQEYHTWKKDDQPGFQRVYRIIKL